MFTVLRSIWALLLAISLLMIGTGLQGSLLSLRATLEGFSLTATGAVMSAFYAGFLLSSMITPRLIDGVGHIRVFAAYASLGSTTVLLHPLFPDPELWLGFRFVTGCSIAGLYVVTESWLNHASDNQHRGQVLSLYTVTVHASMAFGQLILAFTDPALIGAYILISILVSLSLVPVSLTRAPAPSVDYPEPITLIQLYKASPLGTVTCFATGLSQGALFGMGAVYASEIGLSTGQVGLLMSLPLLAVVAAQYPIGFISDRVDRRNVITVLAFLTAMLAAAGLFLDLDGFARLAVIFATYGGLSASIYSLTIAYTNDHLDARAMVAASAGMVFVYGVGSAAGPALLGMLMSVVGAQAFFMFGLIVHLAMLIFALWRMTRRAPLPEAARGGHVSMTVRGSPIAAIQAARLRYDVDTEGEAPGQPMGDDRRQDSEQTTYGGGASSVHATSEADQ